MVLIVTVSIADCWFNASIYLFISR